MSLQTSILLRPSRYLSSAVVLMCVLTVGAGAQLGLEQASRWPLAVCLAIPVAVLTIASWAGRRYFIGRTCWRIDISEAGSLYLTHDGRPVENPGRHGRPDISSTRPVPEMIRNKMQLEPASTLWPAMMVLNLRADDGRRVCLNILPDSTSKAAFRELMVACRWIAAHNNRTGKKNIDSGQA